MKNVLKRLLSLTAALLMLVSVIPFTAFAQTTDTHDHTHEENTSEKPVFTEAMQEVQDVIDEMLGWYLQDMDRPAGMLTDAQYSACEQEIETIVAAMNVDDIFMAYVEICDLEELMLGTLTQEEINVIALYNPLLAIFSEKVMARHEGPNLLKDVTPVTGLTISDSLGNISNSGGTVTASAKGSLLSAKTNNITITNNTGSNATVSFSYVVTNYPGWSFNGGATDSSYSAMLPAGGTIQFSIKGTSGLSSKTANITISNIHVVVAAASSTVTFQYESSKGSVTVDGTAVTSGATQSLTADTGAVLAATPASGCQFVGWMDVATSELLSTAKSFTFKPTANITIQPIFAQTEAWFLAGETKLFNKFNDAVDFASSASKKTVVLMNNATLPAGTYTIPSEVTLLVPFDDARTLYTTEPVGIYLNPGSNTAAYNAFAYRTLTLASGANIVVNGALSLSSKVCADMEHNGIPVQGYGHIQMQSGSNITVNGALYAWGFITGSGTVTANSSAKVYECFQVTDYRGGNCTSLGMLGNKQRVFPMFQYYVQNIEVPMTLYAGAQEWGYTCVYVSKIATGVHGSSIPFIGPDGMFNINSGYIVKDYIENKDRLQIDLYGALSMKGISMKMNLIGISQNINSADYVLPINQNISVNARSGSTITITQDIALLPASEILVESGATCTLANEVKMFAYDSSDWGGFCSQHNLKFVPLQYAPGRTYTRQESDLVDAKIQIDGTVNASTGWLYTTAGGANVFSNGNGIIKTKPGTDTVTYQVTQNNTDVASWPEISITPVKLKNQDGSYVASGDNGEGVYQYIDGVWRFCNGSDKHYYNAGAVTTQPSCESAGVKTYTCLVCAGTKTEAISATGHTPGAAATCTTAQTCTTCNAVINSALGHDWDDGVISSAPTCENAGVRTYTCNTCGDTFTEAVDALGHTPGADATCTTAQSCIVCGAELAEALGHDWDAGVVTSAPTCNESGVKTYTCGTCGDTKTENIDALGHTAGADATCTTDQVCTVCGDTITAALGHNWNAGVVTTPPTCDDAGVRTHTCTRCPETKTEVEAATGHTYTHVVTPPTCLDEGYTTHTCHCGDSYKDTYVDALGHDEITHNAQAPTCNDIGWDAYVTCSRCNYTTYAEKAALGHDIVHHDAQAPACGAVGWDAYDTCSRCDYTTYTEKPALDHDEVAHPGKEPTCTDEGWDAYVTCSRCTYSTQVKKPALGHDEVAHDAKAPTCDEIGWDAYVTCSRCDYSTYVELDARGHNPVTHDAQAPTCTNEGWDAYVTCADCDYTTLVKKPALGHAETAHPGKDPTCKDKGWETYVTCSRCDYTTYTEIDALGHDYVHHDAKAPTCTDIGWNAYETCSRCDYTTYVEKTALDHDYVHHDAKVPTCTDIGWDAYDTCSRCDYTTYVEKTALDHDYVHHDAKAPTCTDIGWDAYDTCSRCDYTTYVEKTALDHDYVHHDAKAPTCTDIGWDAYDTCSRCDYTTYVEKAALDHDYVHHDAKAPTCTEIGWDAYDTCSRCDYTTYAEKAALDHDEIAHAGQDATCTADGYKAYVTCSRCDYTTYEVIPMLGHDPISHEAKAPTCTNKGWDAYVTCSRCDHTTYAEKAALGHAPITHDAKAPTCTVDGHKAYITCSRCDYTTFQKVDALGHNPVHHNAKAPTCTDIGWDAYETCSRCDYTTYVEKAALDHDYVHHDAKDPTCNNIGWDAYDTCSRCDYTTYSEKAALDHDCVHHDAKAPTCTDIGWDAYDTCSRCDYTTYNEKAALNHDWGEGFITEHPTCLDAGIRSFACSRCDATDQAVEPALGHDIVYDEAKAATCTTPGEAAGSHCTRCDLVTGNTPIAALGHLWDDGVIAEGNAPTCTQSGLKTFTCLREGCNHAEDRVLEALDHDYVHHDAKTPTCNDIGWDAYFTCSRCDHTTYVEKAALGHDAINHDAKAPTCNNIGWDAYETCSRCDHTTYVEKAALGHDPIAHDAKAPTCNDIGWDAYETCSRCDYTTYSEKAALGHDEIPHAGKNPTCTDIGWDAYFTCSRCDYTTYVEKAALTHDIIHHDGLDATCTADGYKAYDTCSRCDYTTFEKITKLGHDTTSYAGKAATCTESGYRAYIDCSRCDYTTYQEIEMLGHDPIAHDAKAPTCTDIGWDAYVTCSRCDHTTYVEKAALDHDLIAHDAKTPTCTEIGWDAYETCARCDHTTYSEKAALGHDTTAHNAKAPTCNDIGWDAYVTCSRCDYTTYAEKAALGHDTIAHDAKAPTCTAIGWDAYETCSRCDHTTYVEKAALNHDIIHHDGLDASCIEDGYKAYDTCSRCDYTTFEKIAKLNHDYVSHEAKAPTCTEDGYKAYLTCSRCDYTTFQKVAALGHDEIAHNAKAPTCNDIGWDAYVTCSRCNYTTYAEKAALNHDIIHHDGLDATCTADGYKAYDTCSRCDYTTFEKITKLGHDTTSHAGKPATCTEDGYRAYIDCSRCDYTTFEEIPMLGHDEIAHNAKAPTCTEIGWNAYETCSRCDYTTYVEKTALDHDYVHHDAKAPTCTEIGWDAYVTCSRCDYTTYAEKAALGHDDIHHDAKDPTCTAIGWDAYVTCSRCDHTTYNEKAALGHDDIHHDAKDPTCTAIGWDAYETCSRCDYTTYNEKAALGHDDVHHDAKDPTCTAIGWDAYETCSRCDYTTYNEKAALGHDYADATCTAPRTCKRCSATQGVKLPHGWDNGVITTKPTCTEAGVKTYTCSACGETKTELVKATGHSYTHKVVAPLCEQQGYTLHTCHCGNVYRDTYVDALGHDMGPATCSAPSTCKRSGCGLTVGEALPHTPVADEGWPAMCNDTGLSDGSHCAVCQKVLVAQKVLPALGHDIMHYEAKIPTYSNVGWEAYEDCTRCNYTTYVEIPALKAPAIRDYDTFMENLALLEDIAAYYVQDNPGKDPLALIIKYIRTGVERYNSGSWGIMAGYEDKDFAQFVAKTEDDINSQVSKVEDMVCVTSLKNLKNFTLPNGDVVDFGHMFGTMDITYHNNFSKNHADVAGWAGDLVDLLSTTDRHHVSGAFEEMVADISKNYLCQSFPGESDLFTLEDMYGDLDGYYITNTLQSTTYEAGVLTDIMRRYFIRTLNEVKRADYFLKNRLDGVSTRGDVRNAVYKTYTGNKVISTLEATRDFTSNDLDTLKKACCYAFADYVCRLAGDFVESQENPYYTVFSSESTTLAPGITQQIKKATSADGKQMVYYIATGDITRDDVTVYANYNNANPAEGWKMQRVLDQANAAQKRYGDPSSPFYIENYNVVVSTNGAGYNMQTGEPGGLLVMNGVEYHGINANGFFGILKDGTPIIGTTEEYNTIYKDQVRDGIAGFGATLVKDGKLCLEKTPNYTADRASRTAIGITKTGKVVMMVLDGRQEPWSCGGSMQEIAQIMLDAGCVHAINLDGGGSTTYVSKMPGEDNLSVINRPSDGVSRSVSTSLIMVSTAPSSTKFDHAILESATDYMTIGSSLKLTPVGVSATGNITSLPEGLAWSVSDTSLATISTDGVLTARANGDVTVYLTAGNAVIGSKTIHVVVPNKLYFTKTNLNAVYGQAVALPIKALYDGKEVTINPADIRFQLSNKAAGVMQEFSFVGSEKSGVKQVTVTASLSATSTVKASITLNLFKQGENSFDFDQATGGNREFAWDRVVSNSTTEDGATYMVVDPTKDMVTSYTFAIDMTQIPIPKRLEDLVYMLPGSDMEGASAWTFLMQLAERISVLSEVRPVIRFDPNFDVDYSDLKLLNEYFNLTETIFDETTNTLTLVLKWIDQTQPIDPAVANPLCLVSGIKLTPKANAQWDGKSRLAVVNTGEIGYTIYLRASGLYSFSQKPENQEIFNLFPFVNPDDPSEKGGYFGDVYNTFEDSYTLVKSVKEGWVNEDGGFAYYENGSKYYGIHQIDGLYYAFNENGVNEGKTPYTGLHTENNKTYYILLGEKASGWFTIDDAWYHFDEKTFEGKHGTFESGFAGVRYTFDNGRLVSGQWLKTPEGLQYYYGPYCYHKGWKVIDGERYFFEEYYALTGIHPVKESHAPISLWYEFDENGKLIGEVADGLYWFQGDLFYVQDIIAVSDGLHYIDGNYYYFGTGGAAYRNGTYWVSKTNGLLEAGTYRFDQMGRMFTGTGVVEENGTLYYYKNGKRSNGGVVEYQGDYYYFEDSAKPMKNQTIWLSKTNGLLEAGTYRIDAAGKILITTEVANDNGTLYYYQNGKRTASAGLVYLNGYYYYIDGAAKAAVDTAVWINKTNGHFPAGTYTFDENGRMIIYNGIVNGIYYVNNIKTAAGLIQYEGNYYYAASGGKIVMDQAFWVSNTNGLVTAGTYRFDANGKMLLTTGVVEENGTLYYYQDGRRTNVGLIVHADAYYYFCNSGAAFVGGTTWVSNTNGLVTAGTYRFDESGKMLTTTEVVNENGTYYYYQDGKRTANAGLVQIGEDYYYIDGAAKAVFNTTMWVDKTNGLIPKGTYTFNAEGKLYLHHEILNGYYYYEGVKCGAGLVKIGEQYYYTDKTGLVYTNTTMWVKNTNDLLPVGTYRFAADGKAIMTTEIVDENGTLYYYQNGKRTADAGVLLIKGNYYYVGAGAVVSQNTTHWITFTNDLIPAGTYRFAADGKLIMTTEIVNENGTLYYYQNGKRTANVGLIEIDNAYFHVASGAKLSVNETVWVSRTNGLLPVGSYTFDENGKLIIPDGVLGGYYYENGVKTAKGLLIFNGNYYYAEGGGKVATSCTTWISRTNDLLPAGTYRFAADGKMLMTTGVVDENGTLYYYQNGKRTNGGVAKYNGHYYYFMDGAKPFIGYSCWVSNTNGLFEAGTYRFDEQGRMIMTTEIVEEDGVLYYYENGRKTINAGVILLGGDYYFVDWTAQVWTNKTSWISKTNGLLPEGCYMFGADGKILLTTGIVDGYYYENGVRTSKGVVLIDGDYYYAEGGGKLITDRKYWITTTNGLLTVGTYTFDKDGKIVLHNGVVEENGKLYYYVNGKRTNGGLVEYQGHYYYFLYNAQPFTNNVIWVSNTNGLVTAGTYRFDEQGRMIMTTDVVNENGTYYYYQDGKRTANAGLVQIDEDYYYIDGAAKAVVDTTMTVTKTNGLLDAGEYTFGADGKLVQTA